MNELKKEFVPYDLSLKMKALGFDEPCFGWFILEGDGAKSMFVPEKCPKQDIGLCLAPTYSQAFRWFRDKYGWIAEVHGSLQQNHFYANLLLQAKGEVRNIKMCDTYEEAESACLDKLIEIVESKS